MTSALPTSLDKFVDQHQYEKLVTDMLDLAKKHGATQAEVAATMQQGLNVNVRQQQTEHLEFNRDKAIGITVYLGKRKGSASTSDISFKAVEAAVKQAIELAKVTEEDDCSGLAEPEELAVNILDLKLYHPWDIEIENVIQLATECENKALNFDKKITNSDGASVSSQQGFHIYANTHGFLGAYPTSRHSLSCVVIAQSNDNMVRDYDYTISRDASLLEQAEKIGQHAAEKTVKRLDARKIKTGEFPVIFKPRVAQSIFGHFISAISGGRLFRKTTFLVDSLGQKVFPEHITIDEKPHLVGWLGSAPFDSNGVQTQDKKFVEEGTVKSYVLSAYSARKLSMKNTGNAGGVHNLHITHCDQDLNELCEEMGTGLLVTQVMGQGINLVTGDYSRGASGFWIENGKIQYPVHEITIASNLKDMFQNIHKIGNDIDKRGNIFTGSLWVKNMMVAGI